MSMILNDEQNMLKDTAKDFCANNAPIDQLRRLRDEDSADGFDRSTWSQMAELGWAGIPFPEEHGGLAFGYKGLGVVTEETGRTLVASPLYATVWLGGSLVNLGGSDAQKAAVLPKVTAGELLLALALEESHRHSPYGAATRAEARDGGYAISGAKKFVLDGHVADRLIVAARTSGEPGEREGMSLFLVDRTAAGVATTRTRMVDSRNAANIEFDSVAVGADALVGEEGKGADVLDPGVGHRPHRHRRGDARQHPGVLRADRAVPSRTENSSACPSVPSRPSSTALPTCSARSSCRSPACSRR